MYGIKVWSSDNKNDWYLLRDMHDGIVHVWDKKEDVQRVQQNLKCNKSAICLLYTSDAADE